MIKIKSPTRVDLAGGTLDMWPLYSFLGECKTINVAIDIWTTVTLESSASSTVVIRSTDYNEDWFFSDIQNFLSAKEPKLSLHQAMLKFFISVRKNEVLSQGFTLQTGSESPIGGGLGGSSSLLISMLKAFSQLYKYDFESEHHMVHCAHNIEAQVLNTPTGTQDYYPAISGGLNVLTYTVSGIAREVLTHEALEALSEQFLLVYTGKPHHSGLNNFEVLKAAVAKNEAVLNALKQIQQIASEMYDVVTNNKWDKVPSLFAREMAARVLLTPAFVSPEILKLEKIALSHGAGGIKICGAGGGGCVLIWVGIERRDTVIEACEKQGFKCLNSQPVLQI